MKENRVLSSPGTNKYLRSSLYLKKAVTSMAKLLPWRTLYHDIVYRAHKIMNVFTTPYHHSRFYNHIKILSKKNWPHGPRLLLSPIARHSGVVSSHSLSVRIYACLPLFHVAVATVRAFVHRIPTNVYHEDSETLIKGGPGTQSLVVQQTKVAIQSETVAFCCRYSALWAHESLAKSIQIFNK